MQLFYQNRKEIYEAKNLAVVRPDYSEDHKKREVWIRNGYWVRFEDRDEFYREIVGTYESHERAMEVLSECCAAMERGDAVYRMPEK